MRKEESNVKFKLRRALKSLNVINLTNASSQQYGEKLSG